MLLLLEYILLALTDTQFDKVLLLVTEILLAFKAGILSLWALASPLLIGYVALQLARYQQAAKEARKTIVEKIDTEAKTSKDDRAKIIKDVAENTQVSVTAFDAANNTNAKIAELMAEIAELKKKEKPPIPPIPQ